MPNSTNLPSIGERDLQRKTRVVCRYGWRWGACALCWSQRMVSGFDVAAQ